MYSRYWEDDKVNNRFDKSFEQYATRIMQHLANEVGINGARVEIWSGLENPTDYWTQYYNGQMTYEEAKARRYEKINVPSTGYQWARFDYQIERSVLPLKAAVEANGEKFYANVNYVDFETGNQGTLSHANNPTEFADLVLASFQRLKNKYGITPDSFELNLEPNNSVGWRGAQLGQGLLAVQQRLATNGFNPEFVGPSTAQAAYTVSYFNEMMNVPGVAGKVSTLSYHRYGGPDASTIQQIRNRAQQAGVKTAMLEFVDGNIDHLIEDLTVGHVSAWQQWGAAGLTSWGAGASYYAMVDTSNGAIQTATLTRHLAQVFKYVRNGALRIDASSDSSSRKPVAFINKDGKWVAVVRNTAGAGPIAIGGLPAGNYGVRFTGDNHQSQDLPAVTLSAGAWLTTNLPSSGTATVYATGP